MNWKESLTNWLNNYSEETNEPKEPVSAPVATEPVQEESNPVQPEEAKKTRYSNKDVVDMMNGFKAEIAEMIASQQKPASVGSANTITPPAQPSQPITLQEQINFLMAMPPEKRYEPENEAELRRLVNQLGRERMSTYTGVRPWR